MNHVPCELLVKIINCLSNISSKAKCRLVCKKWKAIIDNHFKVNDLVISDCEMNSSKWTFSNEPIDRRNKIKLTKSITLSHGPIFKNILRLYINVSHISICVEILLKDLHQLKQLEIIRLTLPSRRRSIIELPQLTHLAIVGQINALDFNTPNLSHLRFESTLSYPDHNLGKITFTHPNSIRHLEMETFHTSVTSFTNLKYFFCYDLDNSKEETVNNSLNSLINLKELHFRWFKKPKLINPNLKVYVLGVPFSKALNNILNQRNYMTSSEEEFLCENYLQNNLSKYIPFLDVMIYSRISSYFSEFVPLDFLSRLVNIQEIFITEKVYDEHKLIKLLAHFRDLKWLGIRAEASLSQPFFDSLSRILPQLTFFELEGHKDLNLNFLLHFKSLRKLNLGHDSNLRFTYKLLSETNIRSLGISLSSKLSRSIARYWPNSRRFIFHQKGRSKRSFESREQLLDSFKKEHFIILSKEVDNEDNENKASGDVYDFGDFSEVDSIKDDVSDRENDLSEEDYVPCKKMKVH